MKKICFAFFILASFCLFFLFSCSKSTNLYDLIISATAYDKSIGAGSVLCYGRAHENSLSDDTLSDYLGLSGYPLFKEKIDELAFFSSLSGDYCEIAAMRLYKASDTPDGKLFFERRIESAKRALNLSGKKGYADSAYVKVYGNTVVLYMMPNNKAYEKIIKAGV